MARTSRRALLVLALAWGAVGLVGCGRGDDAVEKKFTVGFSQIESVSPWRAAETQSLRDEARKRGIELIVTDAGSETARQVADVEALIERPVDMIFLAPREYEGLAPALRAAKAAGIPVVLIDREAAGTPGVDYETLLASNFVEQGLRAAEWLAQATGGKAQIVELSGTPGSSVAADRAKGFRDGLARYPGMQVVASQSGDFNRPGGVRAMQELVRSLGTRFTALYAQNDEMALGAIEVLKAAGRRPGTDVIIVSIDGERSALEAILAGELGATVESNPRFGPLAFDTMEKIRRGEPVPSRILVPDRLFDKGNAAQFLAEAY